MLASLEKTTIKEVRYMFQTEDINEVLHSVHKEHVTCSNVSLPLYTKYESTVTLSMRI